MQYRIVVRAYLCIIYVLVCILEGVSCSTMFSCNATHIEVVDGCPRSQQEWEEEAKQKNCTNIVLPCDGGPNALQYHCLINTWLNNTLSVCATPQFINGYRCAEFNIRGNRIEPHWDTLCNTSTPPCPFRYLSTKAFKYQDCYELVKRDNSTLRSILSFVDVTTSQSTDVNKRGNGESTDVNKRGNGESTDVDKRGNGESTDVDKRGNRTNASVLWPLAGFLMVLSIGSIMCLMWKKYCKREAINIGKENVPTYSVLSHGT